MAGIKRDLNDPIVQGSTIFDQPAAGSLTFGPSPSLFVGGSGAPISPTGGSSGIPLGGGTYLDIGFGDLSDAFLSDLIDLIKFLQSDIEKTGNTESTKPIQEALERWSKLLNDYQNGDATLEDLKNFDPGVLGDMGVWSDYYDDFISGEEGNSGIDNGDGTSRYGSHNLPPGYIYDEERNVVIHEATGDEYQPIVGMYDWYVNLPTYVPNTGGDDGGGGTNGGGGLMTGGRIDTGTTRGPGPATESKRTDGGGGGRLDVLGEDWEYDPEHDYIYIGDCTFVRVDENGNPIGEPTVSEYCDPNDDVYVVGGNYSGPDSKPDFKKEVIVDIFGEGSIIDTTKDNTEPEEKDKEAAETEEKDKEKTPPEEEKKDKDGIGCTTLNENGEVVEGVYKNGVCVIPPTTPTVTTTNKPSTGPKTESKRTDGGGEGVITFENMYGYYGNKDSGGGGGGPATENKRTNGDGGDGDGGDGGEEGSMFKDVSLGGTSGSAFTPFQAVPGYTAPTYAPINVPQQDYMAAINNLIARNSSMFKGYI